MMATYNAAVTQGAETKIGLLLKDYVGDITIFDGTSRQPYRAVIDAETADVSLVLRGGAPLYGDANIIEGLVPAAELDRCETITVCQRQRRLCVERDAGKTLAQIRAAVHQNAYALFFCGEPDKEPSCIPFRPNEYTGLSNMTDSDGDGIPDEIDNCPFIFNPIRPVDGGIQRDTDGDGIGDACDPCPFDAGGTCAGLDPNDWDGDGIPNLSDNCPYVPNPGQDDTSGDGIGDACHPCPEDDISGNKACKATIYGIKSGTVATGQRVRLPNALVTAVAAGEGIFLQVHPDDEGYVAVDNSALYVFMRGAAVMPARGDRISITGTTSVFFDQIQLATVTGFDVLSSGNALPPALAVDPAVISTTGARRQALEGALVTVSNVTVTNATPAPGAADTSTPLNEFVVTGNLRVNDFIYAISPQPALGASFVRLTGVLRWANGLSKLEPRGPNDVITGPPSLAGIEPALSFLGHNQTAIPSPGLEVVLNRAADTDLVIDLAYEDAAVVSGPATVTIAAGQSRAAITLTSHTETDATLSVTATLGTDVHTAHVRTYGEASPRSIVSLAPATESLQINASLEMTLTLDLPAPAGGQEVTITLSPGNFLAADETVVVAAGAMSATFDVVAGADDGVESVRVSIGGSSQSAQITVVDLPVGDCLIISEYIEGSGTNNKALELYNCGASPLARNQFGVCLVANQNTTCTQQVKLTAGTIAPGEVWTLCKSTATSATDPVPGIATNCDQVTSSVMNHNGDDRFFVYRDEDNSGAFNAGDTIIDAFGQISAQPTSSTWADMTLRRCNFTPYLGTAPFVRADYFFRPMPAVINDASNFGIPPVAGCP
ncbi:MAG: thrombospondin type 3 repeat-containing protein [Bradymonadaceae bacterium]|nr:thrombospondin type 3 repeat-containing protein [Lujinxingiaceae bacterium]